MEIEYYQGKASLEVVIMDWVMEMQFLGPKQQLERFLCVELSHSSWFSAIKVTPS